MKALLASIAVAAVLYEVVSATDGGTPITTENVGALKEYGSTSIIEPHNVVWEQEGMGTYIMSAEEFAFFNLDDGLLWELPSISPKETVLDISSSGVVAVMRDQETVILRDAQTTEELLVLANDVPVNSGSFSPDGRSFALVLDEGRLLQTWDVESGTALGEYEGTDGVDRAYSVAFSPSGMTLVWFSPGQGRTLDLASGQLGPVMSFSDTVVDLAVSPEGYLLVATADNTLALWDTATATLIQSRSEIPAMSLSYSRDGSLLAMTAEASVIILDMPSMEAVHLQHHTALDASFSPSDEFLVVVGVDGSITYWQPAPNGF